MILLFVLMFTQLPSLQAQLQQIHYHPSVCHPLHLPLSSQTRDYAPGEHHLKMENTSSSSSQQKQTNLQDPPSSDQLSGLPDQLLDNVIDKAFAPLIARQEELELNTLARLQASITVDDLPDQIIENAVHDALAPLLARQEAMENNTTARLESLQALVSSLATIVKNMFQTNTNTEHQIRPPSSAPSSPHAREHGDILITKQLGTPSLLLSE